MTIKWKRNDVGGVSSADGRFEISPTYRHTVRPDGWTMVDVVRRQRSMFNDTQREAKERAEAILRTEAHVIATWGFEMPDPQHDNHVIRWRYRRQPIAA
jgi:hypothetical protein